MTDSAQNTWFMTSPGTYAAVRQECLDNNAEIASIHSAAENQAADDACTASSCYIGFTRNSPGSPWHWESGDTVVYTNWRTQEGYHPQETKTFLLAGGLWGDYEQGQTIVAGLCRRCAADTNIRAIALFPVQAQFLTFANRNQRLHTATAIFDSTAGPSGSKGAVTFDRASSQYIDGGPHAFNIATNGGFTAVAVVKLTGTLVVAERIFDFGKGQENDNIVM